ncbi:hypothetical protein DT73_02255 [Mangrovibacter sp. MFB070]|nr:hypothetical protein DT73_02255 [Mangrovibacter sp. MFB070]
MRAVTVFWHRAVCVCVHTARVCFFFESFFSELMLYPGAVTFRCSVNILLLVNSLFHPRPFLRLSASHYSVFVCIKRKLLIAIIKR